MIDYTVIIPARNEAALIEGAIASALAQTLAPKEIIAVDDGSSDGTGEVAAHCSPKVRVVRRQRGANVSAARNEGITVANTEWIAFLDADDRWHPDKIEHQAKLAASEAAGAIYCGAEQRTPGGRINEIPVFLFSSQKRLRRELLLRNCITGSASAVLVRKDLLDEVKGFDITLSRGEDRDLWIRLAQVTAFAVVPLPLVILQQRSSSLAGDPNPTFESGQILLKKHADLFGEFWDGHFVKRRATAMLYERRGIHYLMQGNLRLARKDFLKALSIWPLLPRSLVPSLKLGLGLNVSSS